MKPASSKLFALPILGATLLAAHMSVGAPTGTLLYILHGGTNGTWPSGGLVQARDGNFYGTTAFDGTYQNGTIYRMTPAGAVTTLVRFDGTNNGINPNGGLMLASDGYLYGTTFGNGAGNRMNQYGTVFRVSTNGDLLTLATFDYTNSGASPNSTLVQGTDGTLYGTTEFALNGGGARFFSCTTNGILGPIYTFAPDSNNAYIHGALPTGLIWGPNGLLYGTTLSGSGTNTFNNNAGTAFNVTTAGDLTTLCYFNDPPSTNKGQGPYGTLLLAQDGNFYGTTSMGGSVPGNSGTVFRLTPGGVLTDIGVFNGTNGATSHAGLVQTADGAMYGTAIIGGGFGVGTVFRVTTNGVITLVVQFNTIFQTNGTTGTTLAGKYPSAPLVVGRDGLLYGTTGGEVGYDDGTLFRINLSQITLQAVALTSSSFRLSATGQDPSVPVVLLSSSNFSNWTPVLTNPPAAGTLLLTDPSATNSRAGFYRARQAE